MGLAYPSKVFPAGAHICYLYHDDEERRRVLSGFVKSGLSAGEAVVYFADVLEPDGLTEAVEELGIPDEARRNELVTAYSVSTYIPRNRFVPEALRARFRDTYRCSRAGGLNGARIFVEMTWALRGFPGSEHLVEHESRINRLVANNPMTLMCQYDMRRFDGATAFATLGVHPMLMVRGEVIPNPY